MSATKEQRIEAALATECGSMEYYLEKQEAGKLTLFFETVRDIATGRNVTRLHDKDIAVLFAAAPDLRDEVIALRAQVERQRAIINQAQKAMTEMSIALHGDRVHGSSQASQDALPAFSAALSQIESEEAGR